MHKVYDVYADGDYQCTWPTLPQAEGYVREQEALWSVYGGLSANGREYMTIHARQASEPTVLVIQRIHDRFAKA